MHGTDIFSADFQKGGAHCHAIDGWLLSYTQWGAVTSPKIHEKLYELMHEIFPFQQTHIFSPKKDHLFKKWDGGQLAFRASLGKSFLNFPNVFFLKSYSKPSQCLQYSQNCLIWKYLLNILTKLTRWRFRLYFSIFFRFSRTKWNGVFSAFQTLWQPFVLYFCWVVVDFQRVWVHLFLEFFLCR